MLPLRTTRPSAPSAGLTPHDLLGRICVRPPYFALGDLALDGERLTATAVAEAPVYGEVGPIAAADLGRHAAIAGLGHTALMQRDDARRYYLAQQADCVYVPNSAPYGTPIDLTSHIIDLQKRSSRVRVTAEAGAEPLATIEVAYAVLTEGTFERLFRHRARLTPAAPSPYDRLLSTAYERGDDWAEQVVERLGAESCVGHFDGYPAMPVAVLMGQLAYLAGRLASGGTVPYRVVRGTIDADDLLWAGERACFRVQRGSTEGLLQRFECRVSSDERQMALMELWVQPLGGTAGAPPTAPGRTLPDDDLS